MPNDSDGLSFFRRACLGDPMDALLAISAEKRSSYAIVQVQVKSMTNLGLSVCPDPVDAVMGHVVVPEINSTDYKAQKLQLMPITRKLAEMATVNILRRPSDTATP